MDGESNLSDFFGESEFCEAHNVCNAASPDDIFSMLEALDSGSDHQTDLSALNNGGEDSKESFEFQTVSAGYSPSLSGFWESEAEAEAVAASPKPKRQKMNAVTTSSNCGEGQQRISHITVERNRRKQMNEHLSVLRSLMPCFYVKGGDQASIIGGVVNYINELQQVLRSLEAKKQRKAYNEVLSPRPSPLSPRKPPLSPRLGLPISPRTPQSSSPYMSLLHSSQTYYLNSPSLPSPVDRSPCNSSTSSINDSVNELVASSKSAVAEVEVKFSGPNLLLSTMSLHIPGQVVKILSALEELALEILKVSISTVDETMLNSFTIKVRLKELRHDKFETIGIECQLSAEELAHQIQQTFC